MVEYTFSTRSGSQERRGLDEQVHNQVVRMKRWRWTRAAPPLHNCLRGRQERCRFCRVHLQFGAARIADPERMPRPERSIANALLLLFAGALRGHCPLPNAKMG